MAEIDLKKTKLIYNTKFIFSITLNDKKNILLRKLLHK